MSVFEDKIKREKLFFNQKEPAKGHQYRFESKLASTFEAVNRRPINPYLFTRIAAFLVALLTISYLSFHFLDLYDELNLSSAIRIEYNKDFENVLSYYDEVSKEKINEIDRLVTDTKAAQLIKEKAIRQLDEIDGSLAGIEKELIKNPNDETIKAAIINNKRKKVEVMDKILIQLDFSNTLQF